MRRRFAAVLAAAAALFGAVGAQAQMRPETAARMFAEHRQDHTLEVQSAVYWTGETAPVFISISREIQDPGAVDAGYDWIFYTCSADGPEDVRRGNWFLSLDLILLDASGQIIYLSEGDEDLEFPGGLCYFDSTDTWLEDTLVDRGFIEFPEGLEPASALIYVPSDERDEVELVSDTYTSVHRPPAP